MSTDIPTPDPYQSPDEDIVPTVAPMGGGPKPAYGQTPSYGAPAYPTSYSAPSSYPQATPSYGAYTAKPDNYLVWGILATLLCCLPMGIASIVFAAKVDSLWATGQRQAAEEASRKAKGWAIASAVTGLIVTVLYIVVAVLGAAASEDTVDHVGPSPFVSSSHGPA